MTRNSRIWWLIGFLIAFVGMGFPYWRLPVAQAGLPDALYGPGLAAVAVVALLLRAFGTGRFLQVWLLVAAAVPVAVAVRIVANIVDQPGAHLFWPFELAIAAGLGLAAAFAGTAIGSLFLLRSSRRPG
ncbi:hypothetical protein [Pseudoxanthomonas putridarboris]|uniref:Uncharacterized protein n=1 Tax=Pseudoxanthomonas putridarboris TaxID=752605 RepID=A0ABU9J3J8_9GAMM